MNINTIIEFIQRQKPDCEIPITQDTRLTDLHLTSLDMLIMACELESLHNISIPFDALYNVNTIGQLYTVIMK